MPPPHRSLPRRRFRACHPLLWGLGCGVWGVGCGFEVWGSGFGVWGLGIGVWCLVFGFWGVGFGVWGLGFEVWDLLLTVGIVVAPSLLRLLLFLLGVRVSGLECCAWDLGIGV